MKDPLGETQPSFSGTGAMCPKCGTTLKTTWHQICLWKGFPCNKVRPPRHFEHMCRTCTCGYGRVEATLDSENPEPLRAIGGTGS